ncbi:unnamed protein product [Brachionus calyciflorus]|uniref:Nuclear receptor domain-containing protein n=1 Tax=Brachionus calyciflorus TaxID=104777 RepID=A0A813MBS1_9BILA|nr:unnamed protein product [Brachionus calyciflorus]
MPLILENSDLLIEPKSYLTFTRCKICHSKANGINYGVLSCRGCKSFFIRSLSMYNKYVCSQDYKCLNEPKNIKNCKHCRWDVCIKQGMSLKQNRLSCMRKKFINMNQKPEVKDQIDHEPESFNSEYCLKSSVNKIVVLNQLKNLSYDVYRENTKDLDSFEHTAKFLLITGQKKNYQINDEFVQFIRAERLKVLQKHSTALLKTIQELPCFLNFSRNDLKTIMNTHFFSTLCLMQIKLFLNDDFYFMFSGDVQLNRDVFAVLFNSKARDIAFYFFSSLKSLDLTEKELGLLIPFILSSINYNLENKNLMKEVYQYYSSALFYEFELNKRTIEFMKKFTQVACSGPEVNKILMDSA